LFEQNVNDYLFSDKFHPNSEGYKLIGERLSSLIVFSEEGNQDD
jgi:lysophospholipase L1-like esterase